MAPLFARSTVVFLLAVLTARGQMAPGAPGEKPHWTNAQKQGVGTANSLASKIWFTLGGGILNEVYYPAVEKPNTRSLELIVSDGRSFAEIESRDTGHAMETPNASAPVFRQINTAKSGRYRITKTYATDPERDTLLIEVRFEPLAPGPLHLYVFYDPSLDNSGLHDTGYTRQDALLAADGTVASALVSSLPFTRVSSGYLGSSDGWTQLRGRFRLDRIYTRAQDGNVAQIGELPAAAAKGEPFTLALGFGGEGETALAAARQSLTKGFAKTLEEYTAGWREYLATVQSAEAIKLRVLEDKTWRGASVMALAIPGGETADASEPGVAGDHVVDTRALCRTAAALHALGDKEGADRALTHLFKVQQQADGSFPARAWLDGRPAPAADQTDEAAAPILLAWRLGRGDPESYARNLRPAAEYIARRPVTSVEQVAALVCAAEIARRNGEAQAAQQWLATADEAERRLAARNWTPGPLIPSLAVARYQRGEGRLGPLDGFDLAPADLERVRAGQPAPDFRLLDAGGAPVKLSEFRGKTVILVFYRGYW